MNSKCKDCKYYSGLFYKCCNPRLCANNDLYEEKENIYIINDRCGGKNNKMKIDKNGIDLEGDKFTTDKLDADTIKAGVRQEPPVDDLVTYNNFWKTNQTFDFDKMTKEEVKYDMVNHPRHYKTKNGLEAIDVIEAFTDGLNGIEASDTANIIKYACRWKKKNGIEDLKKIRWYVNHLIKHLNPNDIEFKEPENHFKCPSCGGDIVRDLIEIRTNDISALINVPGEPTCDSCGRTYVININEDLSYEIINS